MDRPNPKQNIDGNPHYLSEECLNDYYNGIYDDNKVADSISKQRWIEFKEKEGVKN